jgi:hypothetical protein
LYRSGGWVLTFLAILLFPPIGALGVLLLAWVTLQGPGFVRFGTWLSTKLFRRSREAAEALVGSGEKLDELTARAHRFAEESEVVRAEAEALLADPAVPQDQVVGTAERLRALVEDWAAYEAEQAEVLERSRALRDRLDAVTPGTSTVGKFMLRFTPKRLVPLYVALAAFLLFNDRPWLPAERVAAAGQPAVTGYVLGADGDQVVVLVDRPRRIVRLEGVESRRFCWIEKAPSWASRPVGSIFSRPGSYPLCKTLDP